MSRRRRCVFVLLVAAFTVTGCGGSTSDQTASGLADNAGKQADEGVPDGTSPGEESPGSDSGGPQGAPFDQGGRGGGEGAVPAPMEIPAFQFVGADYRTQRAFIHDEIVAACGDGTLCVEIVAEVVEADGTPCAVQEPLPAGRVPRGSKLVFRVAAPCDPTSDPDSEAGGENEGGAGGGDGTDPQGGGSSGSRQGEVETETGNGGVGDGDGDAGADDQ